MWENYTCYKFSFSPVRAILLLYIHQKVGRSIVVLSWCALWEYLILPAQTRDEFLLAECRRTWTSSHCSGIIMSAISSQITSVSIVNSTVYSGANQRKTSKLRVTGHCQGNSPVTGEFPAQRSNNAENVSIWWRHYAGQEYDVLGVLLWTPIKL